MNICVIGLGSMGKRRIRLLKQINPSLRLMGVDISDERRKEVSAAYQIETYPTFEEAKDQTDVCLICTSPITHASIMKQCLNAKKHVFAELNLVADGYDELNALARQNHVELFQSSTMLFRREIAYITSRCQNQSNLTYSYHVGQYLPDWHPWESYRNFFVSNSRTNGCRELFAIELPWLREAFGEVKNIQVIKAKKSNLNIDYPDTYQVLLEHDKGNFGTLWIDVVSRVACRELKVSNEATYITWNGTPDSLLDYAIQDQGKPFPQPVKLYDDITHDSNYAGNIIENMYVDELKHFLNILEHKETPRYTLSEDAKTLALIDRIEMEGASR